MQNKAWAILALLIFVPAASHSAKAGQATAQLNVSATVLDNCTVSASTLNFGSYNAGSGSPTNMGTNLSVTCTTGLGYTIALDGGTSAQDVTARTMSDGHSHTLNYQLYTANDYANIWGDASGGTVTVSHTGTGAAQSIPVFGQIAAAQFVPSGGYSDQIAVTVTY